MKERVLEFIMSAFQCCCQSGTCRALFMMWSIAMGVVVFWGLIELFFLGLDKMSVEEPPPAPESIPSVKSAKSPGKPKKTSTKKKKSVKKKTKK